MSDVDDVYDEWSGRLVLEVQVKFRATTGRPQHSDPLEQGPPLAMSVKQFLDENNLGSLNTEIGEVAMVSHRDEEWGNF